MIREMQSIKDEKDSGLDSSLKPIQENPRILFLEPQPCIRALKYAKGLKWAFKGKVSIIFGYLYYTLNELYGHGDEVFDKLVKLDHNNLRNDIKNLVDRFNPSIIHSHNAPDLLTISAIDAVNGEIPVIHDCHEALTLRETGYYVTDDEEAIRNNYPRQEKIANEQSDGGIYVTEGLRDYVQQRYDIDPSKAMVFYSYICESMVPPKLRRKILEKDGQTHIVYIGTVTSLIKDSHYDLREIFREIANHRIHIHMYVSIWGARDKAYQRLAEKSDFIHYHGHLDQKTLLEEITQYDYGWAGFNLNEKNVKHLDVALPNKVIEYIACELPVLAFPHKTIKNFLEKNRVGLVFEDIDEMASKLKDKETERMKMNVLNSRYKFTVERNIGRLIKFYDKIYSSNLS